MTIGIIGLGDMGMLYAKIFAQSGYIVKGCDLPENYILLKKATINESIMICETAEDTVSEADIILFSVETENIDEVVKKTAPFIQGKVIVAGQTSIKAPEIAAFEKYLSSEVDIATIHALHGPNIDPTGQTLVAINHRCTKENFEKLLKVLSATKSKIEILPSAEIHDRLMADVQVVTHIGFESIGTSFMHRGVYPWINPLHVSGLDTLKMLMTLRIFSYKHHVYSGMALMNPFGKNHVRTYAMAENELFGLMISEDKSSFYKLLIEAKDKVFEKFKGKFLLSNELMLEYSIHDSNEVMPNSHLSLLAMVLTWARLETNPYDNVIFQTPPFKLRVGMAEYLFMNESLLEESMQAALYDKSIRKDDLAFHTAVQEWAHIIEIGDKVGYESHFERTKEFLADKLEDGRTKSSQLIERLKND